MSASVVVSTSTASAALTSLGTATPMLSSKTILVSSSSATTPVSIAATLPALKLLVTEALGFSSKAILVSLSSATAPVSASITPTLTSLPRVTLLIPSVYEVPSSASTASLSSEAVVSVSSPTSISTTAVPIKTKDQKLTGKPKYSDSGRGKFCYSLFNE